MRGRQTTEEKNGRHNYERREIRILGNGRMVLKFRERNLADIIRSVQKLGSGIT